MSVDLDVLRKFGTTDQRIRELFTAKEGTADHALRRKWEERIRARLHEGAMWGLKNYQFYASADLAWDGNLITKELIPLALYAQGKITVKELEPQLKAISAETRDKFIKKDDKGEPTFDAPAFVKIMVNLTRSLITKRVAALATKYTKQYPLYEYEPLGTSFVAKLRGDVLSQRVEMIVNQFGYRHELTQAIREALLYSFSVEFVANQWERDRSIRKQVRSEAFDTSGDTNFDTETYIVREGLLFKRPHPSRVFYDMAYPLASLNTDTGCTFVGYWDLVPYREVRDNKDFFNTTGIGFDGSFTSQLAAYKTYWALYSASSPINFPPAKTGLDVIGANEREKQTGVYSSDDGDATILRAVMFEKVIPRDVGLGDYPFPVWVRLVVSGDETVVYGEIIPYTPAVVYQYNCADGKILNNSFAHECIPWSDQASNMLTNLLFAQRAALIKILALDIDQIADPEMVKQIREMMKGDALYTKPLLVEYKGVQAAEMGMDPRKIVSIAETSALADPSMYFRSMMQLLALAERVLGTSANESSQSEPREVSATESANIASAVNTGVSFMGSGIDEAVSARKEQLYDALMACGHSRVQVPVANRYTKATIEAAGFKVLDAAVEGEDNYAADKPQRVTILGTKSQLEYDYTFSSRDGSDRPSNAKAAEVLVQLLQPLSQVKGGELLAQMGKEQLYGYLNAILRMAGAGVDLQFEVQDGQTDEVPNGDPSVDGKAALEQSMHAIMDAIEQDRQRIGQLEQSVGAAAVAPTIKPTPFGGG